MVRSLQASRTSLERMSPVGSCASGTTNTSSSASTLPRARRGLSPHGVKNKELSVSKNRLCAGGDAGMKHGEQQQPTVETPLSPEAHSLPPLHLSSAREDLERLHIEELTEESEEMGEDVQMVVEELEEEIKVAAFEHSSFSAERPTKLELFSEQSAKKKIYHFNNPNS